MRDSCCCLWQDLDSLLSKKESPKKGKLCLPTPQAELLMDCSTCPKKERKVRVSQPKRPSVARRLLPGGSSRCWVGRGFTGSPVNNTYLILLPLQICFPEYCGQRWKVPWEVPLRGPRTDGLSRVVPALMLERRKQFGGISG